MIYKFKLNGHYEVNAQTMGEAMEKVLAKVTLNKSLRDEFLCRLEITDIVTDVNVEGGD